MTNTLLEQDPVGDIIKTGVTSFLSKNKNVSVGDFLNKKSRDKTIQKLKTSGKSSLLDTGQNVINHFRNEDVARFDKLVKTIKSTPDLSKEKTARLLRIAGKVRGIKESRVMNSSSIEKSGPTIDVKATEVKDKKKEDKKKNGAIVKSKGSSLANRGNKNTEVKKERDPKPYRDKKGEGVKVPWKKVGNKVASGVKRAGKIAQSAVGNFASAYGDSSFAKEELSRRHKPSAIKKKAKLEKALTTLKLKKKKINERFGQWKQAVKNRDKAHKKPNRKAPKQGSIKSRVKKGVGRVPLKDVNTPAKKQSIQRVGGSRGVHTANRKSKAAQGKQAPVVYSYKKKTNEAALTTAIATSPKWVPAAATAIGAIGTMLQIKGTQGNLFPKGSPENPHSTNKRAEVKRNQRISNKAQKSAEDKWRDDNNLGGTNVQPPWKGK